MDLLFLVTIETDIIVHYLISKIYNMKSPQTKPAFISSFKKILSWQFLNGDKLHYQIKNISSSILLPSIDWIDGSSIDPFGSVKSFSGDPLHLFVIILHHLRWSIINPRRVLSKTNGETFSSEWSIKMVDFTGKKKTIGGFGW